MATGSGLTLSHSKDRTNEGDELNTTKALRSSRPGNRKFDRRFFQYIHDVHRLLAMCVDMGNLRCQRTNLTCRPIQEYSASIR